MANVMSPYILILYIVNLFIKVLCKNSVTSNLRVEYFVFRIFMKYIAQSKFAYFNKTCYTQSRNVASLSRTIEFNVQRLFKNIKLII